MENGYTENLTIERIDNNKGYAPDNCKWATRQVQMNNTRCNIKIAFRGQTKTIMEWSRSLKIPYTKLYWRIKHWPLERAFTN
jgi:hypothetical protein